MVEFIKSRTPKKYHDQMIPSYRKSISRHEYAILCSRSLAPGCRRMIRDKSYLSSLHRPNISLNWDGIERVTETGILTKKGKNIV
jgi:hypothetical protein